MSLRRTFSLSAVPHGVRRTAARRLLASALLCPTLGMLDACAPGMSQYASRSAAADSSVRAAIARERSIQNTEIAANAVGVLPLTVTTSDSTYASLGYGVAALLASDLARSSKLVVVERLRLDAVIRELDLAKSGRVDSTSAPRVGRIIGARRIVLGALEIRPNGQVQIGSQIADATSGAIAASLSGSSVMTQIFDAEKAMVFRLFEAMGVVLSPAERRTIERRPTPSLVAFLAYSNGVRAELARDYPSAIASFTTAVRIDPTFTDASARVSNIQNTPTQVPGTLSGVTRAIAISNDLVNRPTPVVVGSGVDAPVTRQQLLTITISVRTP